MTSNDGHRRGLLTAGGILTIVAGILQINNGAVLMAFFITHAHYVLQIMPSQPFRAWWAILFPGLWADYWDHYPFSSDPPSWLMIMGVLFLVLGVLAVVGGLSAVRRKRFGLSVAGAISALLSGLFGILAVIFVGLERKEFRAGE